MSLIAFPIKKPTTIQLSNTAQIEYSFWKYSKHDKNLIHVRAFNNCRPITNPGVTDPNPYPWRVIPVAYSMSINFALYRLEILKVAAKDTVANGGNRNHIETAAINLHYLDMVLDQFWDNASVAVEADEMNGDWRCDVFDRWLRAEFYIHKHSPDAISDWEVANPDIAWSNVPISDLGID